MSPGPESLDGRTKKRPTPLLLEVLLNSFDSEDEYQARRFELPGAPSTEVPVRRTFIEYGSPACEFQQAVSTAPACMGLSMGTLLDSYEDDSSPSTCSPSDAGRSEADRSVQGPAAAGGCCLPAVLYHMSPISAKAAGYWTQETTAASTNSTSLRAAGSSRSHTQDEAEVGSCASSCEEGDSDVEDQDRNPCPVYSAGAELPSVGSALHGEGECKRCCFFPKGRCNNGASCQFCHFAHEKRKPAHKKKIKKRRKTKRGGSGAAPLTPLTTPRQASLGMGDNACVFVPAVLSSQVLDPSSFPHAVAMAVIPVPYVY